MLGKDYTHSILYYTDNMTPNFASSQTFAKAKLQIEFQT